jgi:hypothetical protein
MVMGGSWRSWWYSLMAAAMALAIRVSVVNGK